jgi:Peptidase A4 family
MQNQNWRLFNRVIVVATVTLLVVSFSTFAAAQEGDAVHAMYAAAPKEATNIKGVSIIADRPKGFNPLTATSQELGRYGLPPRPDQQADPRGYAKWARAMQALKSRPAAHLEAKPFSSVNLMLAKQQPAAAATGAATPMQLYSYNWSGVVNVNNLKKWNNNQSFNYVQSIWNVPAAQPPFNACTNGITGNPPTAPGFLQATWNGIDGATAGDVLQGGSLGYADCGGPPDTFYIGWVEWYPSYPILEIDCSTNVACVVNAGDDFYVVTMGANSLKQYVFVEDITQGWGGLFELDYLLGPSLVGSSVEQIVERPGFDCDKNSCLTALSNYIDEFVVDASGLNGRGTSYYPGSQTAGTWIVDMIDDGATQIISAVDGQGNHGIQGLESLWLESEGCAYTGGCTAIDPLP